MNRQEILKRLSNKENFIKKYYGEFAEEWKNETDDRHLYSIMYYDIIEALEQLKELKECNDYLFFEVIMHKINSDKKILQEIRDYFLSIEEENENE